MSMNDLEHRVRSRLVARVAGAAVCCVLGAALASLAGCNIVAPVFILIHGPEKIPPVYTLDPKRPTVVFIDDPASRVPRRQLRGIMGDTIDKILLDKGLVKANDKENHLISSASIQTVAAKDKSDAPMSITQVGKAVGAEIVVWIMVDQFTLSPDGQANAPTVAIRMKIIDTVADKRLYPEEPAGKAFTFVYPAASTSLPATSAERAQAEMDLAEYAGRGISELFYEVEKPLSVRSGNK